MSKRAATRWYIGAWLVAVGCGALATSIGRFVGARPPAVVTLLELVVVVCAVGMFAAWIGALLELASRRSWGWFLFVLVVFVLSLGALGIVPMLVYAVAGPGDEPVFVAVRPSTT